MSVQKIIVGRPTYLNSYEEALLVALAKIEDDHGVPIDVNTLGFELQFVIKSVNAKQSTKETTPKSSSKYTLSVINQVNGTKEGHVNKRKNIITGLVKV